MPYGITQCYLPPGRGDIPAFTPAEAGTRFSDPVIRLIRERKFGKIPCKHGNSMAKGKFHNSAQNSVAHWKLWALLITTLVH